MKEQLINNRLPIFRLDIARSESHFSSAQELVNYFKDQVDAHPVARMVAEFDHYSHTRGMHGGEIAAGIVDARHVVFCFGQELDSAEMMAVRPRSIGIVETEVGFTISFMEAPTESANNTMKNWVEGVLRDRAAA